MYQGQDKGFLPKKKGQDKGLTRKHHQLHTLFRHTIQTNTTISGILM